MKRRTFLKLSPAFVALPLSLELSSCGTSNSRSPDIAASSTSEPTPDVSSDFDACADTDISNYSGRELTLEEAQEYSRFTNCPYFIHWSVGSFSPVPVTLESDSDFVTFWIIANSIHIMVVPLYTVPARSWFISLPLAPSQIPYLFIP